MTSISEATKGASQKMMTQTRKQIADKTEEASQGAIGKITNAVVEQLSASEEAQFAFQTLNEALELYSKLNAGIPGEALKLINETVDPQKRSELINQALNGAKGNLRGKQVAELIDLKHNHYQDISREVLQKGKILDSLRENLQKVKERTDKELAGLRDHASDKKAQFLEHNKVNEMTAIADGELQLEEVNHKFEREQQMLLNTGREALADTKFKQQQEFGANQRDFDQKLSHAQEQNKLQLSTLARTNEQEKDRLTSQMKKERLQNYQRQER